MLASTDSKNERFAHKDLKIGITTERS